MGRPEYRRLLGRALLAAVVAASEIAMLLDGALEQAARRTRRPES